MNRREGGTNETNGFDRGCASFFLAISIKIGLFMCITFHLHSFARNPFHGKSLDSLTLLHWACRADPWSIIIWRSHEDRWNTIRYPLRPSIRGLSSFLRLEEYKSDPHLLTPFLFWTWLLTAAIMLICSSWFDSYKFTTHILGEIQISQ